jgi:hypothetical protein
MLESAVAERARRRIGRLSRSGLDAPTLLAAVAGAVEEVVAYDGALWATVDPATLLMTGAHVQDLPRESAAAFYENEYGHRDVNAFTRLARGPRPVATLAERTGGVLSRSRIHREVGRAFGFLGDELRVVFLAGRSVWGVAALARRRPESFFSQADVSFVASVSRDVGEGLRAADLLDALAGPPPLDGPPGLVLLTAGDEVAAATPQAQAWLEELVRDYGLRPGERAPAALLAVAARAMRRSSPAPSRRSLRGRGSGRGRGAGWCCTAP